jgi:hypothetical protein
MSRSTLFLATLAGFSLAISIFVLSSDYRKIPSSVSRTSAVAVSTLSVSPNSTSPLTVGTTTNTVSSTTQRNHAVQKVATTSISSPPTIKASLPTTTSNPPQNQPSDASATALRNALVNILCFATAGSGLNSISGSGIIIDPKGIILTNAHIGQYFLLADRGVSCIIRSGTPATDQYTAKPIYISNAWVHANVGVLTEAEPTGTGQYDFSLLAIANSATNNPLPFSFPFVPLGSIPPDTGTPVVIASYAAQFLDPNQIKFDLFPTVAFDSVKEVLTFNVNTIDVLDLGGSAAAQEGSSGGGVVDSTGDLVGTITTSTVEGATATRSLNAITASYIRGDYASETGEPLDIFLAESTATSIAAFAPEIPALESVLMGPHS